MPKKQKNKLKKVRKHFKFNLERLAKHLGKIADNTSVKDVSDIALNIGLAYAGLEHFKTVEIKRVWIPEEVLPPGIYGPPRPGYWQETEVATYHWEHSLFGPIALRLAQTDGLISQGAGVAALITLGLAMGGVQFGEMPDVSSWDAFVKVERNRARKSKYAVQI